MSNLQSVEEVVSRITSGVVDNHLDVIIDAVKMRRKQISDAKILLVKPGDVVVFNSDASPKYLRGQKATVRKVNSKTVSVDIPEDAWGARRYRGAKNVRTPMSIVDVVK